VNYDWSKFACKACNSYLYSSSRCSSETIVNECLLANRGNENTNQLQWKQSADGRLLRAAVTATVWFSNTTSRWRRTVVRHNWVVKSVVSCVSLSHNGTTCDQRRLAAGCDSAFTSS